MTRPPVLAAPQMALALLPLPSLNLTPTYSLGASSETYCSNFLSFWQPAAQMPLPVWLATLPLSPGDRLVPFPHL